MADELGLKVAEYGPTNFKTQPGTWIDVILTDYYDNVLTVDNRAAPFHNQHNLIEVTLDIDKPPSSPRKSFAYRAFKDVDVVELNYLLAGCDWRLFDSSSSDPGTLLQCPTDNMTDAINTLAPEKIVVLKKRQSPWIKPDIKFLIRKRYAALRRAKRSNNNFFLDEFLRLRKEVSEAIAHERTSYIQRKITDTLDNNGNFWKDLRNLGLLPKR